MPSPILLAVVEHHDAVGDVHHHAHVVLDQHDGGAELVVDVEDEAAHVLLLLDVHAGHRLVEQQQLGLRGERAAELDALLQAVGQLADRRLADVLDLEEVDDLLDRLAMRGSPRAARGPSRSACARRPRRILQVAAGHDVVERRHALEQRDVLEGAGDALAGGDVRRHVAAALALEGDRALLRVIDAVDDVEHRALAGAVGADDGADLALAHVEADVAQRLHAAEGERYVLERQQHLAGRDRARTLA